jgi:glutamine amidotransferase
VITIVDYGLGNIAAFLNMYRRMNVPARAARTADELAEASHIVLPGVGAFDHAIDLLDASGMRPTLERVVMREGLPVVGVCVGMQILAEGSDEGRRPGLGWIPGRVRAFASQPAAAELPHPHMGWNDVAPAAGGSLFAGLNGDSRFYFLHSFYFECSSPDDVAATTHYGFDFVSAVHRDNVWGVQFHPEKSHHFGAAALRNFAGL